MKRGKGNSSGEKELERWKGKGRGFTLIEATEVLITLNTKDVESKNSLDATRASPGPRVLNIGKCEGGGKRSAILHHDI